MPIRSVFPIPIYVENDKNILIKEDNKLLQKIFYKEGTVLRGGGATGAPEKEFHKIYNSILEQNKCSILCGGTGLYIESILLNYKMSNI